MWAPERCRLSLDDLGQVIGGKPPSKSLQIRPLDESFLEKQMTIIVDGPDVKATFKEKPNAVLTQEHCQEARAERKK